MTPGRRALFAQRWEEMPDLSYWEEAVKRLAASSFACSKTWATIDWLLKDAGNHVKVMEGAFDDKVGAPPAGHGVKSPCKACNGEGIVSIRRDLGDGEERNVASCAQCPGKDGVWPLVNAMRCGWELVAPEPKSLKLVRINATRTEGTH